jgi:short-subunit dehydrogenase involved in D-alanine esterification of teichoic acids
LAERLVDEGSHVIALGRRQENLDALVARKGQGVEGVQFDITQLDQIPGLADRLTHAHPDIDCIILNSGIQRKCDFSDPGTIDMDLINLEFVTNYLSYLALTKAFLPFLMTKHSDTAVIYISSNLALIPIPRVSNYCATKAALHQWILCLREQLSGSNVKVVEVFPPAVQTELHDEKHQPDIKDGRAMGMPLDQFTNEVRSSFEGGELSSSDSCVPGIRGSRHGSGPSSCPVRKDGFRRIRNQTTGSIWADGAETQIAEMMRAHQ